MSNQSLFQFYMDNFFEFPKDLKNDIVYCQRCFQAHLKVHQMVINVFLEQKDADPVQKQRILTELENDIFEINAEQHYILMRLRLVIEDFFKMLKKNGIHVDKKSTNAFISRELATLINDRNVIVRPMRVKGRHTEEKLIEKYFEVHDPKNVYEILDSDEEEQAKETKSLSVSTQIALLESTIDLTNTKCASKMRNKSSQESLLKPKSQRLAAGEMEPLGLRDQSKIFKMNGNEQAVVQCKREASIIQPLVQDSTNVKMSRINLRQALKKVEKENLAKAAARKIARTTDTPLLSISSQAAQMAGMQSLRVSPPSTPATIGDIHVMPIKHVLETKPKPVGRPPKSQKINSESSDSNTDRERSPTQNNLPTEPEDKRTLPEHCGKDTFLRSMGLFTHEMQQHMQQRRSKRRRRCVQSNERADFHYERIEFGSLPPPGKGKEKRRDFLLSPQLKAKKAKRRSDEKESTPPRSSSSSPDDKICCNECLKGAACNLEHCQECKGFYHQTCHREEDEKHYSYALVKQDEPRMCPACCRNLQKQRLAKKAAQVLESKYGRERSKRATMQQASKVYNAQMRNLFNFVNTLKPGPELDTVSE